MRRIDPIDGLVYILAQLSGGVLGALLTKAFILDEGRASDYGTPKISALLGSGFQGGLVEGDRRLHPCAHRARGRAQSRGPALGRRSRSAERSACLVMVLGPLTVGSFNPARWFGPALVGNHFTDALAYIVGPLVGALLAAAVYKFLIEPFERPRAGGADTVAPRGPAPPAGEAPQLRQSGPVGRLRHRLPAVSRVQLAGLGPHSTSLGSPCHAQGHLLAQLHALAVENVPVLLQVLRLRDAPRPHPRPG